MRKNGDGFFLHCSVAFWRIFHWRRWRALSRPRGEIEGGGARRRLLHLIVSSTARRCDLWKRYTVPLQWRTCWLSSDLDHWLANRLESRPTAIYYERSTIQLTVIIKMRIIYPLPTLLSSSTSSSANKCFVYRTVRYSFKSAVCAH